MVWQNAAPKERGKKAEWLRNKPTLFRPNFMPADEENTIKKDTVAADVDTIKELLSRPRL